MDYELWMEKAESCITERMAVNRPFELSSLFEKHEWETLSKGDRISFGRFFANAVRSGAIENVAQLDRAKNNHAKYIKTE